MKLILFVCLLVATTLAGEKPSNCYRTCSGIARNWVLGAYPNSAGAGMVKVIVDTSACGFSSPPHVTTMLHGANHNIQTKGVASGIRQLSATGFHLNVHKVQEGGVVNPDRANSEDWDWELYWTASGYGC